MANKERASHDSSWLCKLLKPSSAVPRCAFDGSQVLFQDVCVEDSKCHILPLLSKAGSAGESRRALI